MLRTALVVVLGLLSVACATPHAQVLTLGEITATAVNAVPDRAEAITTAMVTAFPEQADEIMAAASAAAPERATSIAIAGAAAERQSGSLASPSFASWPRASSVSPGFVAGVDPMSRFRDPALAAVGF